LQSFSNLDSHHASTCYFSERLKRQAPPLYRGKDEARLNIQRQAGKPLRTGAQRVAVHIDLRPIEQAAAGMPLSTTSTTPGSAAREAWREEIRRAKEVATRMAQRNPGFLLRSTWR
jgi:hypothetical protein